LTELLNKVTQGDCLEVMREIPDKSVDMILCDLPYGTTACKWDTIIPFQPLWEQYERIIKDNGAIVLTASQPFTSALIMSNPKLFKYCWVWDKVFGTDFLNAKNKPLKQHEDICIFSKGTTANGSKNKMKYFPIKEKGDPYVKTRKKDPRIGVWEAGNREAFNLDPIINNGERFPKSVITFSNADRTNRMHPTQKPAPLFEYLIKTYTSEGDVVLDNCLGSGTTAVAAINTGRQFIGIERESEYVEIANKRIAEALTKN
jgi:site-specific DNA-methyltransferase (adenine-specific)